MLEGCPVYYHDMLLPNCCDFKETELYKPSGDWK